MDAMPARPPDTPRGRSTGLNPANRFERLRIVPDDPGDEDPRTVPTHYLRDTSRSVLSTNDSPDVPFDVSLNPYRGCEAGCVYCLSGDTSILMADGTTKPLRKVRPGDAVYGTTRRGWYRQYVRTRVTAHWEVRRPAYRVLLRDGTELVAGGDHRFLTERGWKFVSGAMYGPGQRPYLTTNNKLMGTGRFDASPDTADGDYRRGYLAGLIRGDGHLAHYFYEREGRAHGNQHQFRLTLADLDALERATTFLHDFGISVNRFVFQAETEARRQMEAVRTHSRAAVAKIEELVEWPGAPTNLWRRGYLAGLYDAEGSWNAKVLRVPNSDRQIVDAFTEALEHFNFRFVLEHVDRRGAGRDLDGVRLRGGLREVLRFWHWTDNAISRKRELEGRSLISDCDLGVAAIKPLEDEIPLFDITTGTGDFIADGVVSHNCYARPTHEYLGFSAGLDFESRILVKEDAPELLRAELAKRSWRPRPIGLSGVTDPYQPIEHKLGITRRCLEVLADCRNPVMVVTKNAKVRRDIDLLQELARHDAVSVAISITTLDASLVRRLEPRTTHPQRRLDAVRELNEAGVPAGVLVAPILPAITVAVGPAIVEAAAAAGARFAGYTVLRLPGAVEELFTAWLEEHFPDRKEKVLNRIRDMRGGELNETRFGKRMRGEGIWAEQLRSVFELHRRRLGLDRRTVRLSTASFRPPRPAGQLALFDT